MKTIVKSILLILVIVFGVIITLNSPLAMIALEGFFSKTHEVNADNRPIGKYFKGRVYETSRDLIMVKDDSSRRVYMVNRYRDVNGEVFPMDCDTHYTTWKRVSKGTQFTIKDVKIDQTRLGSEWSIPLFYAEFEEPFDESPNELVKVSCLFSFDFDYLGKEKNRNRDRDVVITECMKPKIGIITEIANQ